MSENTYSVFENLKNLGILPEAFLSVGEHNLDFSAMTENYDIVAENLQLHRWVQRLQEEIKRQAYLKHELNNLLDCTCRFINLALSVESQNTQLSPTLQRKVRKYLMGSKEGLERMMELLTSSKLISKEAGSASKDGSSIGSSPFSYQASFSTKEGKHDEQCDINEVVKDAVDFLQHKALDKGVEIKVQLDENLPDIETKDLFHVFVNLINNAFDAMGGGGTLEISTSLRDGKILVKFSDDGDGIPDEFQSNIFDAFSTTKVDKHHHGLGLNICKQVITKHNGTLYFDSRKGKGTTFTVAIPVSSDSVNQCQNRG